MEEERERRALSIILLIIVLLIISLLILMWKRETYDKNPSPSRETIYFNLSTSVSPDSRKSSDYNRSLWPKGAGEQSISQGFFELKSWDSTHHVKRWQPDLHLGTDIPARGEIDGTWEDACLEDSEPERNFRERKRRVRREKTDCRQTLLCVEAAVVFRLSAREAKRPTHPIKTLQTAREIHDSTNPIPIMIAPKLIALRDNQMAAPNFLEERKRQRRREGNETRECQSEWSRKEWLTRKP